MSDYLPLLALINDKIRDKNGDLFRILDQVKGVNNINDIVVTIARFSNSKSIKIENIIDKCFEAYKWEISKLIASDVNIIPYFSDKYPKLLNDINNPPVVIYHRGNLCNFDNCTAIVGSRNLSHYGHKKAHEISNYLAGKGITIVSGLARGVDTEAHLGALDANGRTIAILPSSISNIYPKENSKLVENIIENGAIISEISSLEKIQKTRFIERNRITSGISKCVIVIETSDTGGTMHQVRIAKEQSKKIFVLEPLPGDFDALKGYNKILSFGGIPFISPEEIYAEIGLNNLDTNIREKKSNQNLSLFL